MARTKPTYPVGTVVYSDSFPGSKMVWVAQVVRVTRSSNIPDDGCCYETLGTYEGDDDTGFDLWKDDPASKNRPTSRPLWARDLRLTR